MNALFLTIEKSLCSVDSGSPAEEAGLQVGDQVMDVNGHSFISIQHQEAVHILRSYQNLILTIKVHDCVPFSILRVINLNHPLSNS